MKTIYVQLAEISLQQEYRKQNQSIDIQLIPTPDCQRAMARLGWVLRMIPNGYGIFARSPSANRNELHYADEIQLVLRFVMLVPNPNFYHFADLGKAFQVSRNMLYFNNIKKPTDADKGLLTNNPLLEHPDYNRMPIRFVATPIYRDTLVVPAHVTQTILTVEAQRNDETVPRLLKTFHFNTPDTDSKTKIDYSIDLSAIDGFTEGRYELFKTVNSLDKSTESIFYAPDLKETPMGLIELWASRGEQPFLDAANSSPVRYHLPIQSKPILLQYVVENTLKIEDMASDIPKLRHRILDFDIKDYTRRIAREDTATSAGKVYFTAPNSIKWQDTMKTPNLIYHKEAVEELYPLPIPESSVAPEWDNTLGQYIVKTFITF